MQGARGVSVPAGRSTLVVMLRRLPLWHTWAGSIVTNCRVAHADVKSDVPAWLRVGVVVAPRTVRGFVRLRKCVSHCRSACAVKKPAPTFDARTRPQPARSASRDQEYIDDGLGPFKPFVGSRARVWSNGSPPLGNCFVSRETPTGLCACPSHGAWHVHVPPEMRSFAFRRRIHPVLVARQRPNRKKRQQYRFGPPEAESVTSSRLRTHALAILLSRFCAEEQATAVALLEPGQRQRTTVSRGYDRRTYRRWSPTLRCGCSCIATSYE